MAKDCDVLIVGAGVGGCAAALAACDEGARVILTEESDWIGGQLTSQAVPPDENPWVESFGANASYQDLRHRVRAAFRSRADVRPEHRADPLVNPGGGWVSALCAPPEAFHAALEEMLAPHVASGRLTVLRETVPDGVSMDGDAVREVRFKTREGDLTLSGSIVVDATECGDLLPLVGIEFVTGAESHSQTGEPNAPAIASPRNQQAITWCFAMAHDPGHGHLVPRPPEYEFWRRFQPEFWPGPLLGWDDVHPVTLEKRRLGLFPGDGDTSMFAYRQIVDRTKHKPTVPSATLVNWPLNDAFLTPVTGVSMEERAQAFQEARALSLCLAYWLQNDAPRPDGGRGYPDLRLCPELMGTADGLAKRPYIREAARIVAHRTIVEQDLSPRARPGDRLAERYEDSVGIGFYRIDLHPSTGGDNYIDVPSLPFLIPLSALIPVRAANLLPGAKNIGSTHITNGCYRLHPVEWAIGEAVGVLASSCALSGRSPQEYVLPGPGALREDLFERLDRRGVRREWPEDLDIPAWCLKGRGD